MPTVKDLARDIAPCETCPIAAHCREEARRYCSALGGRPGFGTGAATLYKAGLCPRGLASIEAVMAGRVVKEVREWVVMEDGKELFEGSLAEVIWFADEWNRMGSGRATTFPRDFRC